MPVPSDRAYEVVRDLMIEAGDLDPDHHLGDVLIVAEVKSNDNAWAGVYAASGALDGREPPPWRAVGLARWIESVTLTQPQGDDGDE